MEVNKINKSKKVKMRCQFKNKLLDFNYYVRLFFYSRAWLLSYFNKIT